jgi:oligopeptide transport system substrate-binding protein
MSDFCLYRKEIYPVEDRPKSGLGGLLSLLCLLMGIFFAGCKEKSFEGQSEPVVLQQRLRARVQTLDPMDVRDTTGTCVASDIFDTLYDYHYLKRPYEIIPMLAAAMPAISDDGKCYTISIRKDVYFHDDVCFSGGKGRLLKAQDVVYAWKRIADIKTRSGSAYCRPGPIPGVHQKLPVGQGRL